MSVPAKGNLSFRAATSQDLPAIVRMLAHDALGSNREDPLNPLSKSYRTAFETIDADPNNELVVAATGHHIVGVFQITFIPNLTYQGGWRALIEGVRVSKEVRLSGIGRAMFEWAINRARERGCILVQLTTDKTRLGALRFYEQLGFVASHEGMKLKL